MFRLVEDFGRVDLMFVLHRGFCHFSPCGASGEISPGLVTHSEFLLRMLPIFYCSGVATFGAEGSKRKINSQRS